MTRFRFFLALGILAILSFSKYSYAQQANPPLPPRTTSPRAMELAEQLRRTRETRARNTRPNNDMRLITMNLTGIETFGDALGAGSNANYSGKVIDQLSYGSGAFIQGNSLNVTDGSHLSQSNNVYTLNFLLQNSDPALMNSPYIAKNTIGSSLSDWSTGTGKDFRFGQPVMNPDSSGSKPMREDVLYVLDQIQSGGSIPSYITVSPELIDYLQNGGDINKINIAFQSSQATVTRTDDPSSSNNDEVPVTVDGGVDYKLIYFGNNDGGGSGGGGTGGGGGSLPILSFQYPGGGNIYGLGRQKITENLAPLPTNRFIFDYSYFHNVPFMEGSMPVNRFTFGIEKTFLKKRASFEMRLPLATTFDSDLRTDGTESTDVLRVGDMTLTFKYVLLQRKKFALTTGLSVSVPLADDLSMYEVDLDHSLFRVNNESVHIMPYIGMLYLPTDRFFMQGYFQVDAAANGDSTFVYDGTDMAASGRAFDRTYAYTSLALGYWLFQEKCRHGIMQRGLNLVSELHWTTGLDRGKGVEADSLFGRIDIGKETGNYDVVNLTLGGRYLANRHLSIGAGYAVPLTDGRHRQFDGEFRLSVNRYF